VTHRICPACSEKSIPISELLLSHATCPNCKNLVGPHWFFGSAFYAIILLVTVVSTIIVLAQFGIYAAILWFSFPIGAIGYLKARFSPLVTKQRKLST
jgi:hypothetical protein